MSEPAATNGRAGVTQAAALLFIHAQTSLHPGSGTALGVVDLPVQRERHTQWPVIPGSTLKGIVRDACTRRNGDREKLQAVFGPEKSNAADHAGALSLTDARLLAFPVRSLKGVFAWVTCAAVLERLRRDVQLTGAGELDWRPPTAEPDKALCPKESPLLTDGDKLILEEFEFTRVGEADAVAAWVAERATNDDFTQQQLKQRLVVLHDDDFTHFVRHATEVTARVALDYERKTVKRGALFYEEFLPPETVFYAVALAGASRRKGHELNAGDVMEYVRAHLPPVLQIGGDETIGKGLCAVRLT
ncbi:MAG: type III-B CRISPR module RAMP protein Cmr4 [Chloracidobacterium sp.]|nr:type III-B CRISPR module RAMP protein Cmr4 [Chloracidobacterium sp.]MDW8218687.1 type III-B CRISPR module RAMP protein Cmr4 [Acidobacteriota bacterium]